jgi:hypothetical protein
MTGIPENLLPVKPAITRCIDSVRTCMKVRDKERRTRGMKNLYSVSHIPFPYISYPERYITGISRFLLLLLLGSARFHERKAIFRGAL